MLDVSTKQNSSRSTSSASPILRKTVERLCSIATIPFYIGTVAAQLVAIGFLVHTFSNVSLSTSILIAGLAVGSYTILGGLWAVVMTDFVELFFIIAALGALLFPVLTTPEYLTRIVTHFLDEIHTLGPSAHPRHGYLTYIGMLTMTGFGALMGQDLMQRIFACKDARTAKISLWLSAALYLLLGVGVILFGYYCRQVVTLEGDAKDLVFTLIHQNMSPIVVMLFILGMLSATMSTADSYLLAGGSILCQGLFNLQDSQSKQTLLVARLCNLLLCFIAALLALLSQNIYGLMVHSGAFLFVSLFVPVTGALYLENPPRSSGWISLLFGFTGWAGYLLYQHAEWSVDLDGLAYAAALIGASLSGISYLTCCAIGYGSSSYRRRSGTTATAETTLPCSP